MKNRQSPTDLQILQCLYDEYYEDFIQFDSDNSNNKRDTKIFVPVDCKLISEKLHIDGDIVFRRLYEYLNSKYSGPGKKASFFILGLGDVYQHHINFPLLASVLADLQDNEKKYEATLNTNKRLVLITLLSAITALASFIVAVITVQYN